MRHLIWKKVKISKELWDIFECSECHQSRYPFNEFPCNCQHLDDLFGCMEFWREHSMTSEEIREKYGSEETVVMKFLNDELSPEEEECVLNKFNRTTIALWAAKYLSHVTEKFNNRLELFIRKGI